MLFWALPASGPIKMRKGLSRRKAKNRQTVLSRKMRLSRRRPSSKGEDHTGLNAKRDGPLY
jgi:hypothetical protein